MRQHAARQCVSGTIWSNRHVQPHHNVFQEFQPIMPRHTPSSRPITTPAHLQAGSATPVRAAAASCARMLCSSRPAASVLAASSDRRRREPSQAPASASALPPAPVPVPAAPPAPVPAPALASARRWLLRGRAGGYTTCACVVGSCAQLDKGKAPGRGDMCATERGSARVRADCPLTSHTRPRAGSGRRQRPQHLSWPTGRFPPPPQ